MELSALFGGIVVSLLVQYIKTKFATTEYATIAIAVVLSLVGAIGYMILLHLGLFETALKVFTIAGAFYVYIIKRF